MIKETELKTFTSVNRVLFVVCLYSGHVALNGTCDNDCTDIIICDVSLQLNGKLTVKQWSSNSNEKSLYPKQWSDFK